MISLKYIKNWFAPPPEFKERNISHRDRQIVMKAVKLYFFLHQMDHNRLPEDWAFRFSHSSNVVYSMLRGYMLNGKFEIEYLDFLNQELAGLQDYKDSLDWRIPPDCIDEIELNSRVPVYFSDEETNERLEVIYYPEHDCAWYRFY